MNNIIEHILYAEIFLPSVMFVLLQAGACLAQTVIHLNPESEGRYMLDATVNGVGVRTYYTEESWFASMSSTTKAGSFVIRNLRIGNVIVKDLPAFVI